MLKKCSIFWPIPLTNKFLHQPSIKLRQASQQERDDVLLIAQDLFLKNDASDESGKTE